MQGSLAKVQSERPDLAQSWQQDLQQDVQRDVQRDAQGPQGVQQQDCGGAQQEPVASSLAPSSLARGDRTARERWQLVRLVSRIGLQQRAEEPAQAARSGQRPFRVSTAHRATLCTQNNTASTSVAIALAIIKYLIADGCDRNILCRSYHELHSLRSLPCSLRFCV